MKKLLILTLSFLLGTMAIKAQPVASFIGTFEVCGNEPAFFESTSSGDPTFYHWMVVGGSGGATNTPTRTYSFDVYNQTQIFTLCLTVNDAQGLEDTHCEEITVHPDHPFTIINETLCQGESITEGGNVYDQNNPYGEEYFTSFTGCDSIVVINLQFESGFQVANIDMVNVPFGQSSGGSISFDPICGSPPYTYDWSPALPGTQNEATNLSAGLYTVTVTDVDNNSLEHNFQILEGQVMEFDVNVVTKMTCENGMGGQGAFIQLNWSGGTPPYTLRKNGGSLYFNPIDVDTLTGGPYYREWKTYHPGPFEFSIEDGNGNVVIFPELISTDFIIPHIDYTISPQDNSTFCDGDTVTFEAIAPDAVSFQWHNNSPYIECPSCPNTEIAIGNDNYFLLEMHDVNGCRTLDTLMVLNEDCDPVWPGDTDTNKVVNNFDLLNIGLAFDATGVVRQDASLDWIAQPATNWANSNPNGSNYKHSDTDGNGSVDANDTLAITLNWGETHNFTGGLDNNLMPGYPPAENSGITIPFYVQPDTFSEGETLALPVILGEMGAEADNIYGVAFSLEFDPAIIVPGSAYLTFDNSWIGNINQNMIDVQKTFHGDGRIDICLTRINHENMSGFGQMGEFFITIEDDIFFQSGGSSGLLNADETTTFNITNVLLINSAGEQLDVAPSETTSLILDQSTNFTKNISTDNLVTVHPNPANDQLWINTKDLIIEGVQLFSLNGELLQTHQPRAKKYQIATHNLKDGIYIIKVNTIEGVAYKRVTILH